MSRELSPHLSLKPVYQAMCIRWLTGCEFYHQNRHDNIVLISGFEECKHCSRIKHDISDIDVLPEVDKWVLK